MPIFKLLIYLELIKTAQKNVLKISRSKKMKIVERRSFGLYVVDFKQRAENQQVGAENQQVGQSYDFKQIKQTHKSCQFFNLLIY
ncbi:hypothetical protein QUF74_05425 [Candidatus Halobeggiatoa sp. HSG11]|nr:hypothetical protein [Candidatus Halobeggiatoa sp. HSG11]